MLPTSFLLALPAIILLTMIRRTASLAFSNSSDRIKVSILGSGISGCTVASTLLESSSGKFDITLYEGGRGIGGRMSTRRSFDDAGKNQLYQFDHGCQSIFPPKSKDFRKELDRWKERGWAQPWNGTFGTIRHRQSIGDEDPKNNQLVFEKKEGKEEERFVGYPRMNSICEHLLQTKSDQSTIEVVTQTRAHAAHLPSLSTGDIANEKMWQLKAKNKNEFKVLGDYDWLVVTDRNSAKVGNPDLKDANVHSFSELVNDHVKSIPSCTTMVVLDKPLPLPVDGLQLDYDSQPNLMKESFGTLGWIARDSSKPGRMNDGKSDGAEYWVLQSNRREGERLLGLEELNGAPLSKIRSKIQETMVEDFEKSIPLLMQLSNDEEGNSCGNNQLNDIPKVVESIGHRWGAAFPLHVDTQDTGEGSSNPLQEIEYYMDAEKQFIACGDYFGEHIGTVEGAFLSGRAAANRLIEKVTEKLGS